MIIEIQHTADCPNAAPILGRALEVARGHPGATVVTVDSRHRPRMHSMETKSGPSEAPSVDLAGLFSDLVRLETELWDLVDHRLREAHELPLSWFEPMQVMDRVVDCRAVDIAGALSITVGGVSKLIDRIEHAGWCGRAPNPNDARSSVVALTRAGRRVLAAARASCADELVVRLEGGASPEQLASLASTIRDLRRHLAAPQGGVR